MYASRLLSLEKMMREDNEVDSFLLVMVMLSERANKVISNEMKHTNFRNPIVNNSR